MIQETNVLIVNMIAVIQIKMTIHWVIKIITITIQMYNNNKGLVENNNSGYELISLDESHSTSLDENGGLSTSFNEDEETSSMLPYNIQQHLVKVF